MVSQAAHQPPSSAPRAEHSEEAFHRARGRRSSKHVDQVSAGDAARGRFRKEDVAKPGRTIETGRGRRGFEAFLTVDHSVQASKQDTSSDVSKSCTFSVGNAVKIVIFLPSVRTSFSNLQNFTRHKVINRFISYA